MNSCKVLTPNWIRLVANCEIMASDAIRYDAIWWDAFESIFSLSLFLSLLYASVGCRWRNFLELRLAKWQRQTVISNSQLRFGELCLTRFKLIYSPLSANFRSFFAIFHIQVKSDEYDDYEIQCHWLWWKDDIHTKRSKMQRKKSSVVWNYQWKYPSIHW